MSRALGAILILAAAGGCKKGGGAAKPLMERELVHATPVVSKLQLDIALPKGVTGGPKDAASAHWTEAGAGGPTLDLDVATGKAPVAMQNAVNAAASDSLTVTRSDELPDGWMVSGNTADGASTKVSRQIKVSDTAAVVCTTTVTWAKPEAKNVEWAESFCKSLVVKPQ